MTYFEKLKHPKWQKKRLDILNRDSFTCQYCGDKESTLHVHHFEYLNPDPWDIDDSLLITCCQNCHVVIEFLKTAFDYKASKISYIGYGDTSQIACVYFFKKNSIVLFVRMPFDGSPADLLFYQNIDDISDILNILQTNSK
jgi:hypothetical protein